MEEKNQLQTEELFEGDSKKRQKTEQRKVSVIIIIILGILFLGFLGFWYFTSKIFLSLTPVSPSFEERAKEGEDSLSDINQELEKIEALNVEEEFKQIEEDLNYL